MVLFVSMQIQLYITFLISEPAVPLYVRQVLHSPHLTFYVPLQETQTCS